jgi:lipopolysaccharide/colanic/teichoic acid biosynthesis glycosyltransferase
MKRAFDLLVSGGLLVLAAPVLVPVMVLVWLQDFHSPFYLGVRAGRNEAPFRMVKLRSMRVNADRSGVDSTSADDRRITPVGKFIRAYKLDELMQLWNVLLGDMSLTGPRPNVLREVAIYTPAEKRLLSVRPGITDLASIVFADEGEILAGATDPDLLYNQIIRPWKSRLALFHVDHQSMGLDVQVVFLTAVAILSRERALGGVERILRSLDAPPDLVAVARRREPLRAAPPPGASSIVTSRDQVPSPL